jgi:hypothetical protein
MTGHSFTLLLLCSAMLGAQTKPNPFTAEEKPIADEMRGLRKLSDDERPGVTKRLALEIRKLPAQHLKVALAENLANLSTEGDPGHDTLEEVATTLAQALAEQTIGNASGYMTLAQLVRYEHVQASSEIHNSRPPCPSWKLPTGSARVPTSPLPT